MSEKERKTIEIPEICRVEGHAAVHVDICEGRVTSVQLDVFEGTRFFERIVLGHHFAEIPHITSRVCAICSTGHVLAAACAVERILAAEAPAADGLFRELMHLGMVIESHATHIYALALPDYLGAGSLMEFAARHEREFRRWNQLRSLGAAIQSTVGGRPFHPVNLHVGGLSRYPSRDELSGLARQLQSGRQAAMETCELLLSCQPPVCRTTEPVFLALVPAAGGYGYFGDTVKSSDGWEDAIDNYRLYLAETAVAHSHAKRSSARGKPLMVGAMARLMLFGDRLGEPARGVFERSPLAAGDSNSLWNNLAQAVEIVEAVERCLRIIEDLLSGDTALGAVPGPPGLTARAGKACGAVECPRGTLYHYYELDQSGRITAADMITPSAQNSARIELDIREVVDQAGGEGGRRLQSHLETLVRAYDPCNTCATHMVSVRYS